MDRPLSVFPSCWAILRESPGYLSSVSVSVSKVDILSRSYFFQIVGVAEPFTANLIIYIVLLFGNVCSFYLVERVGRRILVLFGSTACGICVICIGALGSISNQTGAVGSALIALSCIWVYAYAVSLAPIGSSAVAPVTDGCQAETMCLAGWIFVGEVSTSALRSKTAAFATLLSSLIQIAFVSPNVISDAATRLTGHIA